MLRQPPSSTLTDTLCPCTTLCRSIWWRRVIDAAPQDVIPDKVTYVASVAQFTPKTVETESEREKLMFRVKARIDPELLRKHMEQVKTGLPGMAYLKLDAEAEWPAHLQINVGK